MSSGAPIHLRVRLLAGRALFAMTLVGTVACSSSQPPLLNTFPDGGPNCNVFGCPPGSVCPAENGQNACKLIPSDCVGDAMAVCDCLENGPLGSCVGGAVACNPGDGGRLVLSCMLD